jgi:hypothetical protein
MLPNITTKNESTHRIAGTYDFEIGRRAYQRIIASSPPIIKDRAGDDEYLTGLIR